MLLESLMCLWSKKCKIKNIFLNVKTFNTIKNKKHLKQFKQLKKIIISNIKTVKNVQKNVKKFC